METVSGSVTGTKQFIWSRDKMCEERNASGTLLSQFFRRGQTIGAANYFYTKDHLDSVRDLTDTYGVSQAHYDYTPFGQVTKTGSSIDAEFQFCGMYTHAPSQLNLAIYRAYQPVTARWIERDPLEENGGINLYTYVENIPTEFTDPFGLVMGGAPPPPPPPGRNPNDPNPNPAPPDSGNNICDYLEAEMNKVMSQLPKRRKQYKNNQHKLPEKKCDAKDKNGSREGHRDKYSGEQTNLSRLADAWSAHGCGPLPDGVQDALDSEITDP